uniref:Calponin-homology (CH) domain-containing protein n=1 Tax=Panagrolaimus sp. ES5 TaxID=591445 RepID=A0AC34FDG5_9BILA
MLPGKNDSVTKTQFINFLKDGTLLAKFANTLSPGSIEKVYEGEEAKVKENQVTNVQNFVNFVKEKAGFTEADAFTVDDLQENGKSGYNAVFNTLFQLGIKAQEKFNAAGIDVDAVIEAASTAVKNSIIQTIWNFFKRVRPQLKSKAETSDEKTPTSNGTNGNGVIIEETPVSNVVPVVATSNGDTKVVDEIPPPVPTTAAPAVAAQ